MIKLSPYIVSVCYRKDKHLIIGQEIIAVSSTLDKAIEVIKQTTEEDGYAEADNFSSFWCEQYQLDDFELHGYYHRREYDEHGNFIREYKVNSGLKFDTP